jgi:predicted metalloprotease
VKCDGDLNLKVIQTTDVTTIVYLKFDSTTQQAVQNELRRTLSQDAKLQAYAKAGGVSPPTAAISVDAGVLNNSETENITSETEFLQSFISNVTDASFKQFFDSSAKMSTNAEIVNFSAQVRGNCNIEFDQFIGLKMQVQEMLSIFATQLDKNITEVSTKQTSDQKATSDSSQGSGNMSGEGSGGSGAIAGVVGVVVGLVVLIGVGFFVFRSFSSRKDKNRRRRRKSRSSAKRDDDDDEVDDDEDEDVDDE